MPRCRYCSPALPSAPALVLVLVLVLDDPAIGDANGALDQGCLQAAVYLYSSPFKYLWGQQGQRMGLLRAILG